MSISPNAATAHDGAEDRRAEPARVADAEVEPAAEEVGGDRKPVVADAEHDAAVGRGAAEDVLRDQRPDDDERRRSRSRASRPARAESAA